MNMKIFMTVLKFIIERLHHEHNKKERIFNSKITLEYFIYQLMDLLLWLSFENLIISSKYLQTNK